MSDKYNEKLEHDKVFLLSMIDDPARTFRAYGFNADEHLINMLDKISNDILDRAKISFKQVIKNSPETSSPNACHACR